MDFKDTNSKLEGTLWRKLKGHGMTPHRFFTSQICELWSALSLLLSSKDPKTKTKANTKKRMTTLKEQKKSTIKPQARKTYTFICGCFLVCFSFACVVFCFACFFFAGALVTRIFENVKTTWGEKQNGELTAEWMVYVLDIWISHTLTHVWVEWKGRILCPPPVRIQKCTSGRAYILRFTSSDKKMFFWMQEPSTDKDCCQFWYQKTVLKCVKMCVKSATGNIWGCPVSGMGTFGNCGVLDD